MMDILPTIKPCGSQHCGSGGTTGWPLTRIPGSPSVFEVEKVLFREALYECVGDCDFGWSIGLEKCYSRFHLLSRFRA